VNPGPWRLLVDGLAYLFLTGIGVLVVLLVAAVAARGGL
jgi:hypothetical protein